MLLEACAHQNYTLSVGGGTLVNPSHFEHRCDEITGWRE